ncbi:MAG: glycosyltransferase [Betaproteobacteria bacterium]|nr:glycosyltransferase [Betaproteobacteria bacterium]
MSVIIPAWFGKPGPGILWLDEALESVRAQTFKDWEVIVVDDGSPVPVSPARTDDIVLIRQANTGPGGARNRAAQYARGEFVAYIDADDRWRPEKLDKQVKFFEAYPDVVLVFTDILLLEGDLLKPMKTARQKGVVVGNRIPFEKLFFENCVGCSTVMLRRTTLAETAGMDPHRRMGEDFGLWLRVAMLGPIGYLEEPLLERRHHPDSLMSEQLGDGTWLNREREVYDEFLAENPQLRSRPFVRKAMARLALQGGWSRLALGQWAEARRLLLASVKDDPTRIEGWINLARGVLHVRPRHR